jgi:hypothetical protein
LGISRPPEVGWDRILQKTLDSPVSRDYRAR